MDGKRGFTNHTLQAWMILTGVSLALGIPALPVLFRAGPLGVAAFVAFLAAALLGPGFLAVRFEAGYVDNGCLGSLLAAGGFLGAWWAGKRLIADEPLRAGISLAFCVGLPWAFYGGIRRRILLEERREARAKALRQDAPAATPKDAEGSGEGGTM